uniref:C-type lectin domain-containing protein n=1 Tax=Pelodiscus sinensis TaxID=13735 RepID=K7G4M4_PELSI
MLHRQVLYFLLYVLKTFPQTLSLTDHPPCPRWHRLALQLGPAGIFVLVGVVIMMGIWAFSIATNCLLHPLPGSYQSRQILSTQGPGCKLCPSDWRLHWDKCYWVSEDKISWNKSRDNCSRRGSRLPVIRDQTEMTFIQNTFKDRNGAWLGLVIRSPLRWTWMNGSPLNTTLPKVKNPPIGNNCGVIKENVITFESCDAASKCICEKD